MSSSTSSALFTTPTTIPQTFTATTVPTNGICLHPTCSVPASSDIIIIGPPTPKCDGYTVNSVCIRLVVWADLLMQNSDHPASVTISAAPDPTSTSRPGRGFVIVGPSDQCVGFKIDGHCVKMDMFRGSGLENAVKSARPRLTMSPTASAGATDAPLPHSVHFKLLFIAIPIALVFLTILAGIFYTRRKSRKTSTTPASNALPNHLSVSHPPSTRKSTIPQLFGPAARDQPALMTWDANAQDWKSRPYSYLDKTRKKGGKGKMKKVEEGDLIDDPDLLYRQRRVEKK